MYQLSPTEQRWLKSLHVTFSGMWVGATIALNLMLFFIHPTDGKQLYGVNLSMKFVDDFIIIPGATGCLITGAVYSVFTQWGWFQHRWIMVKWGIMLFGFLFGMTYLAPWTNSLVSIAKLEGLKALTNPEYIQNKMLLSFWVTFQNCTIIFAVFISIFKPWKKRKTQIKSL
jgi:hypothetical protein